jgi:hypothetical protein
MAHKRSIRLQCMMSFPTVSLLLFQPSCLVPTDYLAAMLRVRRPSIQNIRKRYSDRVPPGPNTWTLNILPLGQFPRTVSPIHIDQQCDPFATYRPVSCLYASMICRCIAIPQPSPPRCRCVPWAMAPTNIGAAGGALEAAAVHIDSEPGRLAPLPASADAWTGFLGLIRLVRRPSPPRPIGLVEPTLLLDREGFDVLRCRRTGLDARSHGPRPHGRSRVTLLVLAVFGARCDRCRCRASDKHRTENKSGQHGGFPTNAELKEPPAVPVALGLRCTDVRR